MIAAAGLAGACLATSPLYAADLFGSAPPPLSEPMQTELGSNWYIRGDVGWGQVTQSTVEPSPQMLPNSYSYPTGYVDPTTGAFVPQTAVYNGAPLGNPGENTAFTRGDFQKTTTPVLSVGGGYRVNDFLRVEATYQYFRGPGLSAHSNLQCVTSLDPVYNYPNATAADQGQAQPAGYLYNSRACDGRLNATQFNNAAFANAYLDLGRWGLFMPYVGAGVGVNANTLKGSLTYTDTVTGQTYQGPVFNETAGEPTTFVSQTGLDAFGSAKYTPLPTSSSASMQALTLQQNWNRSFNSTKFSIAGQVMAGFGVPISQSAVLDVSYKLTSMDLSQGTKNALQSVNLGVRYNIN
jgi:opacity protein-like surface antigen